MSRIGKDKTLFSTIVSGTLTAPIESSQINVEDFSSGRFYVDYTATSTTSQLKVEVFTSPHSGSTYYTNKYSQLSKLGINDNFTVDANFTYAGSVKILFTEVGNTATPGTVVSSLTVNAQKIETDEVLMTGLVKESNAVRPVVINSDGQLAVQVYNPTSAFGELLSVTPIPVVQLTFPYDLLLPSLISTTVSGSGAATSADKMAVASTGGAINSFSTISSKRAVTYRAGQGLSILFTGLFSEGSVGSTQIVGAGDSLNALAFGFNGTSFGILYRSGGVDTWIPQTEWNNDHMDGSSDANNYTGVLLDPTKLNVFKIQLQYLGAGAIKFFMENPITGLFTLVHTIKYANTHTVPSLSNPSMSVYLDVRSTSSTSPCIVKTASFGIFTEGPLTFRGVRYGLDNNKSAITTLTNILTLRTKTTLNSIPVKGQIRIRSVSVASDGGNGVVVASIVKSTTLGGTPSYTSVDATNSITEYDVAGTTVTGGYTVWNSTFATNTTGVTLDLTDLDIFCGPGDTLTFSGKSTAGTTISIAVNWSEDH